MQANLEYPDGSYANADTGIWLHHALYNLNEPNAVCPTTTNQIFATGNERTAADMSYSRYINSFLLPSFLPFFNQGKWESTTTSAQNQSTPLPPRQGLPHLPKTHERAPHHARPYPHYKLRIHPHETLLLPHRRPSLTRHNRRLRLL